MNSGYSFAPPGSQEAVDAGCRCPVLDNHHGAGIPCRDRAATVFLVNADCPLHAKEARERLLEEEDGR